MNIYFTSISTPIGEMIGCATDAGVCMLEFNDQKNIEAQILSLKKLTSSNFLEEKNSHLNQLEDELNEYFEQKRQVFSISLDLIGTDFQKRVWNELLKIPFAQTISYIQQATLLGSPSSVRAVANANGMNKIAIIVPCHRVIGTNGTLTGYAGGLERKKWLLDFESPNKRLFNDFEETKKG